MKHTHTEGSGSILKSRFARGLLPLVAALLAFALAAPSARAAAVTPPEGVVLTDLTTTTSGSVPSASATPAGYPASKAFDGNKSNTNGRWLSNKDSHMYVIYRFNDATAVNAIRIWSGDPNTGGSSNQARAPKAWTFSGSNDGSTWVPLDEQTSETGWSSGGSRYYQFANNTAYEYYKYDCTELNGGTDYLQIWELEFYHVNLDAPRIGATALARTGAAAYSLTATEDVNAADLSYILDNSETVSTNGTQSVAESDSITWPISGLVANKTYQVSVLAENASGSDETVAGTLYTGELMLGETTDASENGLVAGTVAVSRNSNDPFPLTVSYTISSSATGAAEGTTWAAPTTITIPAGETTGYLLVTPLLDSSVKEDIEVTVTLAAGNYEMPATVAKTLQIINLVAPSGYNTWVATADGLASVGSNWSAGVAPTASDNVLFDGRFSTANCEWDSAASATVASWTQNADYTGTVEIQTTYASGAFPLLSIAGNCIVSGGKWTHPANNDSEAYRLKVSIGGGFTLAAAATVDVTCKGYAAGKFPSGSGKGVHGGGCGGCGATYGDPFVPERLGSGYDTAGGGAVYLTVSGAAIVNGTITTAASQGATSKTAYGAPGSIYLRAASITGSGYVYAHNPGGKRCAGGRIALHATAADEIGIHVSHMSVEGGFASVRGGSGTLLLRTQSQSHGVLHIDTPTRTNYFIHGYPFASETTVIPEGQTWTVDGLCFRNSGILTVAPGTTLALPGGFASVTGESRTAGILYNGGTITSAQSSGETLAGKWTFQANTNYVFTGNVTVRNGASIGGLRLKQTTRYNGRVDYLCDVRVNGNLTVESDGWLNSDFSGYTYTKFADNGSYQNCERFGDPYAHGGQIYLSTNGVYGSILAPAMPGTYGSTDDTNTQNLGGGALRLVVDGALTLDGKATSVGGTSGSGLGTGGSINITAGSLSGSGTMSASGCKATSATTAFVNMDYMLKNRGVKSASAGGRIAVRLTDAGASFTDHWKANILATGALNMNGNAVFTNGCASAGTVYLQTAAEGEGHGTIYVRNGDQTTNPAMTPIPSTRWGGERDDLTKASLAIGAAARVKLFENLKMASLDMASGTVLDLNGKTLTVKSAKLGGAKLSLGTYAASNEAVAGFVADSGAGGELVVGGGGFTLIVR